MNIHPWFGRLILPLALLASGPVQGWDHPGHRIINQLALAALPADFPAFVHAPANVARIGFLAGEPDRWSHAPDAPLKHVSWPDHFLDVDVLSDAGLDPHTVASFRYDFAVAYAAGRKAHPDKFAPINPAKNADHTQEWQGFLPWTITEYYGKLRSEFASLKVYQEVGTPEEAANAEADVIHTMGLMGHFVGDCAQPLHTSRHHDGWVGPNPHGYTTSAVKGFHTWIDSGFIRKAGIEYAPIASRVVPAQPIPLAPGASGRDPVFDAVMDFLLAQNQLVEPLYIMEKAGQLSRGQNEIILPQSRTFFETQLLSGGEMLARIWLTAWRAAAPDTYLRGVLLRRQAEAAPAPVKP